MKKASLVGALLFILGICAADSASMIPTILLCTTGGLILTGSVLCSKDRC